MRRLLSVAGFTLRAELTRLTPHVTFGVFFALALIAMLAIGGVFDGAQVAVGGTDGSVKVDAPYTLGILTAALSLFAMIAHAGLAGGVASRDFSDGIHPLVYTTPVRKHELLGGRFLATLVVNLYVVTGLSAGLLVGLLAVDPERKGALTLTGVVAPYLSIVGPNVVLACVLFFALAGIMRAMFANYVGGVGLLVGYLGAGALASDIENRTMAALADPFGFQALEEVTRYWTSHDQNTLALLPTGLLLANRGLWLGIAVVVGLAAYALTPMDQHGWQPLARFRRARPEPDDAPRAATTRLDIPATHPVDGPRAWLAQYTALTRSYVAGIVRNRYFAAFVIAALLFLALNADVIGSVYGTTTWPVTYMVLDVFGGSFALFNLIIITFYAGDLIWTDRDAKLSGVVDAAPVPTGVQLAAKLTALWTAVAVLQLVIPFAGVIAQALGGYTRFEPALYLQGVFLVGFPGYALLCVLALAIHAIVDHKYIGHGVMILYYAASAFRGVLGFEHNLYFFGSDPGTVYSDLNGWGWFVGPFALYQVYWGLWAVVLAVGAWLLATRGSESTWRRRLSEARGRANPGVIGLGGAALAGALGVGGFLFYQTNIVHGYRTSEQAELDTVDAEKLYRAHWYAKNQPRIHDVDLHVDLYPETGDFAARGTLAVHNRGQEPITEVFLSVDRDAAWEELTLSGGATERSWDDRFGIMILDLDPPMMPGEQRELRFDMRNPRKGMANRGARTSVVGNGSFINTRAFVPTIGYDDGFELRNDHDRRKHDLPPRDRMLDTDDPWGLSNTYIANDADWVGFRATVCTAPDQVALAPGYLQDERTEDGRRCFDYAMDQPILHFASFLSGRYEITRDALGDLPIEVYHHPDHDWNVPRMIDAVKKSLTLYEDQFTPYQHRQVRILEFPRYASFAQSFPNTIPYSEAIGFIAHMDEPDDVDYPFYVTAHEVAHQWWAHQVIGASVKGATVTSETLSQYSAMLVMQREYGDAGIRRFLEYELRSYLQGRATETKQERPLVHVENQQYIHYNKGALVMWALRDALGEDVVNGVLRDFLVQHQFRGPPYVTTEMLVDDLRAAAGPDHAWLIEDLFETITLHENKVTAASAKALPDGRYEVTLTVDAAKVRADADGRETPVPVRGELDIGVFADDEDDAQPLYLAKHALTDGEQQIVVVVDALPAKAGVDPYHVQIDRHPDDNTIAVEPPDGA